MNKTNKVLVIGIVSAMVAGFAFTAAAQGSANTEVGTAHAHALMAQSATTVKMAHTHLQHVVNCLVGPKGSGFDAAAGNPCKGQGDGALSDVGHGSAVHGALESALKTAKAGLKASSLASIQNDASKAATTLQGATAATSSAATAPGSSQ